MLTWVLPHLEKHGTVGPLKGAVMALIRMLFVTGIVCIAFILGTQYAMSPTKPLSTINSAINSGAAMLRNSPTPTPKPSETPKATSSPSVHANSAPKVSPNTPKDDLEFAPKPSVAPAGSTQASEGAPDSTPEPQVGDYGYDANGNVDKSVQIGP